jgi:Methyltransferase domain
LSSGGAARSFSDLFARLGTRRPAEGESSFAAPTAVDAAPVFGTKALRKFLASLAQRENPVLLDLGPVVGSNVNFFGEQLGCKIFVEDIYADIDRHVQGGREEALAEFLSKRFVQQDKAFDGILCWDVMDYLDKSAAQILSRQLFRLVKDEGTLLCFFGMVVAPEPRYTKYIIVDEVNLKHRSYPSRKARNRVMTNRDITIMFENFRVVESFLLQNNIREILFRRPGAGAAPLTKS